MMLLLKESVQFSKHKMFKEEKGRNMKKKPSF